MSFSRRELMIGAGAAALAMATGARAAFDSATAKQIDAAVDAALKSFASPGVQVAIADKSGVVLSRGYGLAEMDRRTPVSERSVFRIGSLTKQFTAAAVIKLAAAGRVSLGAPVSTYLPFMGKLERLSLLELMHHTAGLHSDESDASPPPSANAPRSQVSLAEEIAGQKTPFDFKPGTAWLYSNANYIVLGAVIEAVTRKPFAEAMAELVFAPLGLEATAVDRSDAPASGQAIGYTPAEGKAAPYVKADYIEISEAGGAGAMRSTASDLCLWHRALLSNKLFDREHVEFMTTPGKLRDGRVSGANRFSPDDAHYGATQYACGLLVSPRSDAHPSLLHYGAINGFAAVLQTWTDVGVTMAVLCNGDIGPSTPFRPIRQAVLASLPAKP